MNKLILLFLFLSTPLFAQEHSINDGNAPTVTSEMPRDPRKFDPYKGHWLTSFGFEGMKYEVPYEFSGARKNFRPSDLELWGGRFGLGREFYLGKGFNTVTKVETYYSGTLFSRSLNAAPQEATDVEFAYVKKTGQVWGADAVQSLGFMFDFKTKNPFVDEWSYLTVEPYIEAGVGFGSAFNKVNYHIDTGTPPGAREDFKQSVDDKLVNTRFGGGVNFTSTSGYFFYMKAFINHYDVTERQIKTFIRQDQGVGVNVPDPKKDVKLDPITTYAIGGGYKF